MAQLSGQLVNATLGGFLITPNNTGITGTVQQISDGNGLSTALGLSTGQVNCSNVSFNGTTLGLTTVSTLTVTPNTLFSGNTAVAGNSSVTGNLTVTGTFTGTVGTTNISNNAVTYAKIQTVAANSFLGNTTGSAAQVAEIAFPVTPALGGTGVNNGSNVLTLAGSLTTIGAFGINFTSTNNTAVTLPTTGTLSTLANVETLTNKTLTNPKIADIEDTNGNVILNLSPTSSAVNALTIDNAATSHAPTISATGTDTNIAINLQSKGTFGTNIFGRTSGVAQTAGFVGEVISSQIPSSSAVSIAGTAINVTSISLTPGVWCVYGGILFTSSVSLSTATSISASFSTTSATLQDPSLCGTAGASQGVTANVQYGATPPNQILNISTTTTVFLVAKNVFAAGAGTVSGLIAAWRVI